MAPSNIFGILYMKNLPIFNRVFQSEQIYWDIMDENTAAHLATIA